MTVWRGRRCRVVGSRSKGWYETGKISESVMYQLSTIGKEHIFPLASNPGL